MQTERTSIADITPEQVAQIMALIPDPTEGEKAAILRLMKESDPILYWSSLLLANIVKKHSLDLSKQAAADLLMAMGNLLFVNGLRIGYKLGQIAMAQQVEAANE